MKIEISKIAYWLLIKLNGFPYNDLQFQGF